MTCKGYKYIIANTNTHVYTKIYIYYICYKVQGPGKKATRDFQHEGTQTRLEVHTEVHTEVHHIQQAIFPTI